MNDKDEGSSMSVDGLHVGDRVRVAESERDVADGVSYFGPAEGMIYGFLQSPLYGWGAYIQGGGWARISKLTKVAPTLLEKIESAPKFKVSDEVRVIDGPYCGRTGKIDELTCSGYVIQLYGSKSKGSCYEKELDLLFPAKATKAAVEEGPAPRPKTPCVRCGAESYVGLFSVTCLRVGGCKTEDERIGEPVIGKDVFLVRVDVALGAADRREPAWGHSMGSGRAWATRDLAVAAWREARRKVVR